MNKKTTKVLSSQNKVNKNIVQEEIVRNPDYPEVITLRHVQVLDWYRVRMRFSNDETRELDLKSYLRGPVFAPLRRDLTLFRQVFVDAETETLTWPTGVDMDPETLYEDSTKVQVKERRKTTIVSPSAKAMRSHSKPKKNTVPRAPTRQTVILQTKHK